MNEESDRHKLVSCFSRRSFLEQVPALIVLPALSGIGYEVRGQDRRPSSASPVPLNAACAGCAECTARFCRYKIGGKETTSP